MPLLSCAIYVSSGVSTIAARVARAAAATPCVAIVDTFTDEAYARSSVKLVAEPETLLAAATAAATQAFELVDLSQQPHPAPHPRQGSVDMVSFMPLSEESVETISSELDLCDGLAWRLGHSLGTLGCPVLMYGPRSGRSLLETRRGTSFFESCKAETPREATTSLPIDFGGMADGVPQKCGVAIVGVQPCMHRRPSTMGRLATFYALASRLTGPTCESLCRRDQLQHPSRGRLPRRLQARGHRFKVADGRAGDGVASREWNLRDRM